MIKLGKFSNAGFDRGAPAWQEALWIVVRCLLFENPLPWPSALKTACLRAFGARVGTGVVIRSQVKISFPWRLTLGKDVWIGDGVWVLSLAHVSVGDNVCLSQRSYLCTGSHDFRRETFNLITKEIAIGESSWIAADAFVGPGVSIGAGSVVAAGSVVMEDVPPGYLVRGNPAQRVKPIFAGTDDARRYS